MKLPTNDDMERWTRNVKDNYRADSDGHVVMPEMFNGSQTYRNYMLYWYDRFGFWPSRLKKSCTKDNCVSHYTEQGHVLSKEDVQEIKDAPDYWGVNTMLAEKYGVSKVRIGQIRGTRR